MIRLFGGVSAATDGGGPVDIGSGRSQAVLAALALTPRTAVPVSRLVDLVWGEEPPRTAEKTLQWHIAQLRRGLGPGAIVRVGASYRLDVAADSVDVARFQRLLAEGDVAAALLEWTAPPLAGLDAPGLAATVDGLVEQWMGAVEADLERRIDTEAAALVGPLTELCARHPFRENLWALLMLALDGSGRQGDALATYQKARQNLVDQLGVEPGPRLRAVEARILRGGDRTGDGGPVPGQAGRGNLPRPAEALIGRADDLDAVRAELAGARVVSLVGPGGIGKTRLALAAASTVDDAQAMEVWLVGLADIGSAHDVPRVVADTLGIPERPGRPLTTSIVETLRSRRVLLVLDNCEHLLDGAAGLVEAVTTGCPDVVVLATTRERLNVAGEQLVPVGPLDPAGAGADLFAIRAQALDRAFDAAADRDDIEEICRRVDGIPLAIELAAAQTRTLTPAELRARLGDRLGPLVGGRRTASQRQRTLRATLQWSYDLLGPDEQRLLQRLSVFAGPFDLAAAEAVGEAAAENVGRLVDASMLVVDDAAFGRRFRLLDTLRQFAAERRGPDDGLDERHARWCVERLAYIHGCLNGPQETEGVERLAEFWTNLRAAVDWAGGAGNWPMVDALVRPVVAELALRGRHELGEWARRLATAAGVDDGTRAFYLMWTAELHTQSGDPGAYRRMVEGCGEPDHPLARFARAYAGGDSGGVRDCLPDAIAALERSGEGELAVFIGLMAAGPWLSTGQFHEVDAAVSTLVRRYRDHGPPTLLHWGLQVLAYSAAFQQRPDDASAYLDEADAVALPPGTLSANQLVQARSAFRRGEVNRAFALLATYIDEQLELDNVVAASVVAIEFITMMARHGRLAAAARLLGYLRVANEFGALAAHTLVAEAAATIASAGLDGEQAAGSALTDRDALLYMREVLLGAA